MSSFVIPFFASLILSLIEGLIYSLRLIRGGERSSGIKLSSKS